LHGQKERTEEVEMKKRVTDHFTKEQKDFLFKKLSNDSALILKSDAATIAMMLRDSGMGQLARSILSSESETNLWLFEKHIEEAKFFYNQTELLLRMTFDLGATIGEILSLKWFDVSGGEFINFNDIEIWRVSTISESTQRVLTECYGYVLNLDSFGSLKQKRIFPFEEKTANRRLGYIAKRAGLTGDISWRTVRNTYFVDAIGQGIDLPEISEQTGVSLSTIAQKFSKYAPEGSKAHKRGRKSGGNRIEKF
jgi:integrase